MSLRYLTLIFAGLVALCAPALSGATHLPPETQSPTEQQAVPDFRIQARVRMALSATPGVSADAIWIRVRHGHVRLRGRVRSEGARQAAVKAASRVAGVVSVSDLNLKIW